MNFPNGENLKITIVQGDLLCPLCGARLNGEIKTKRRCRVSSRAWERSRPKKRENTDTFASELLKKQRFEAKLRPKCVFLYASKFLLNGKM